MPAGLEERNYPATASCSPCLDYRFASTLQILPSLCTDLIPTFSLPTTLLLWLVGRRTYIAIAGSGENVVLECSAGAGLAFINSLNVSLHQLRLRGCGMLNSAAEPDSAAARSGYLDKALLYRVAILLMSCTDISLTRVLVTQSNGLGVSIRNSSGKVIITESQFINNTICPAELFQYAGGGGISIQHGSSDNVIIKVTNCTFSSNNATLGIFTYQQPNTKQDHHAWHGKGGGLALFFWQEVGAALVEIDSCIFNSNSAKYGGGLYLQFEAEGTLNCSVIISSSNFDGNSCYGDRLTPPGSEGGGTRSDYSTAGELSNVLFSECNFTDNSAVFGGGVSVELFRVDGISSDYLHISDCKFESNTGHIGSAMHTYTTWVEFNGFLPCTTISETVFTSNHIEVHSGVTEGLGGVYSDRVLLCLQGKTAFINNSHTALVMSVSALKISKSAQVVFSGNSGHNGGALALLNTALLSVGQNCRLTFTHNTAHLLGGAIYVAQFGYQKLDHCFIHYFSGPTLHPCDWNVSFVFEDNYASNQENSIYTPSILSCLWPSANSTEEESVKQTFCWKNWQYSSGNCTQQIQTAVAYVAPQNPLVSSLRMYPGQMTNLPIQSHSDYSKDISSTSLFSAWVEPSSNATVHRYISNNKITAYSLPETSHILVLDTLAPRVVHIELNITFELCPPGFIIWNNSFGPSCVCGEGFRGTVICDAQKFRSYLHWGHFLMYDESTKETVGGPWTVPALRKKSSLNGYNLLPKHLLKLNEHMCSKLFRQGFLCSKCFNGTSAPANMLNYVCVNCTDEEVKYNWIFFIAQEIVPATVFFLVIVIFNISATSGQANAFVLFAQMVTNPLTVAHYKFQLEHVFPDHEWAATLLLCIFIAPYSIWNLDFFSPLVPPFCIAQNMKTIQSFALQYLLAFYPLTLICVIYAGIELYARGFRPLVWMWKPLGYCLSRWRRNWEVRTSIIDAFATFLLLAYTKFCLISMYMLIPLRTYNHAGNVTGPALVFSDLSVVFASHEHIYLMVIAVFVIVFIVLLPPLFLLVYPLRPFQRLLTKWRIDYTAVRTFVDAFQGCYKDGTNGTHDCRYFASIYFGVRLLAFCLMTVTGNLVALRLIQTIIILFFILAVGLARPYKNDQFTNRDLFILIILEIVIACAFYNAAIPNGSLAVNTVLMIATLTPLVFMSGLVARHILFKQRHCNRRRNRGQSSHSEVDRLLQEVSDDFPDRVLHPEIYVLND